MSLPWTLQGFPDRVPERIPGGGLPDEVQKAYELWKETRRFQPTLDAERLRGEDRYTADVTNACFADHAGGWQLVCDFEVYEADPPGPGRAVFVDMGFVPGRVLRE